MLVQAYRIGPTQSSSSIILLLALTERQVTVDISTKRVSFLFTFKNVFCV